MNPTRRILLVEDEPTLQRILGSVLTDAGHGVESVGTAEQALERLADPSAPEIDLVLSDKNLPAMNGLDLLERLRADEDARQLVRGFVMVTGYPSRESALRALELRCDGYMVKPFRSLVHAVKRIERVLTRPLDDARAAAARAFAVQRHLEGGADGLPADLAVAVALDDAGRRQRVVQRLEAAGVRLLDVDALADHPGPAALVAGRGEDLVSFRARSAAAGLVLVDGGASFQTLVDLMDAKGAAIVEPVRLVEGDAP